jgi:hypothetical protein
MVSRPNKQERKRFSPLPPDAPYFFSFDFSGPFFFSSAFFGSAAFFSAGFAAGAVAGVTIAGAVPNATQKTFATTALAAARGYP